MSILLAYIGLLVGAPIVDHVEAKPKDLTQVGIVERLGNVVPFDLAFRDDQDTNVTLDSLFTGDLPVLLTFNYSSCPLLCTLQLSAFTKGLSDLSLAPNRHFKIVTISLDPEESAAKAQEMKEVYLDKLPTEKRKAAAAGWTFLRGPEANIRRLAKAVGFNYQYIQKRKEYAHPSAVVLLSSRGKVTRYVQGLDFPSDVLQESIYRAGRAEESTSEGFAFACYFYDSNGEKKYARMGASVMRYGSVVFTGAFAGIFCMSAFGFVRRKKRRTKDIHRAQEGEQ